MANEASTGASGRGGAGRSPSQASDLSDTATSADMKSLSAQLDILKEDVATLTATLTELAKSGAREGRARVEQTAEDYYREGRRQADAVLAEARALGEEVEGQIGRNPITAVLIALGLGFLIGLMSRR
ncbi:DUF883 family protein [Faunimonas sp. B44]|uniref:DUF883 family protein n=1 Tax=Faunimonas sp. B44 TaxID=3461493 RepID=UPI0040442F07